MSSGNITFNKDDKSSSSKFLTDPYGNGIDRFYWWGNQRKLSSENCKKAIKDFEELKKTTTVSKYHELFMYRLKSIQSLSRCRIEYEICNFIISGYDDGWCFANKTLKPLKQNS